MLKSLSIRNYAIIDELDIDFSKQLNIITGETGAGKSILLGALSLILGKRADSQVLYKKEQKCIVEAVFDVEAYQLRSFFEDKELDFDRNTIIRRELTPSGKSRAFINDTPVNLSILKELSGQLVSLHAQHETSEVNTSDFQISAVDQLCDHDELLNSYASTFIQYNKDCSRIEKLKEEASRNQRDLDYFQFQLNELLEANLIPDEQESLEAELKALNHAEEIKTTLRSAIHVLDEKDASVIDELNTLSASLDDLAEYKNEIKEISDRLNSCIIEIAELTRDLEDIESSTNFDQERIEELTDRLNLINKLEKKHNASAVVELIVIRDQLDEKVQFIDASSDVILKLELQIQEKAAQLQTAAKKLRANRLKAIPQFEKNITAMLKNVGMPNARFKIELVQLEENRFTIHGLDKVGFLFSANKGTTLQPLNKVASGGELSRLMLAIKSQMAENISMPTLIFDEIDTGISGEVAIKVGAILQKLSKTHQIISITHLPQIASKAEKHFYVYKELIQNRTNTKIKELNKEEQLVEIAKMLSGDKVSDAALANARELLLN